MFARSEKFEERSPTEYSFYYPEKPDIPEEKLDELERKFNIEIVEDLRVLYYCSYCTVDQNLKHEMRTLLKCGRIDMIADKTCKCCKEKLSDKKKGARDSHEDLMREYGHDKEFQRRMGYVLRGEKS